MLVEEERKSGKKKKLLSRKKSEEKIHSKHNDLEARVCARKVFNEYLKSR
jgi:hypothetical protein